MVVNDQYPHDDPVLIRTSLPPPVVENVASAVLVRNIWAGRRANRLKEHEVRKIWNVLSFRQRLLPIALMIVSALASGAVAQPCGKLQFAREDERTIVRYSLPIRRDAAVRGT
jgi:hypothetical protein